jgi:hypothetical protein
MSRTVITITTIISAALMSTAAAGERQQISGDIAGELDAGDYIVKSTLTVPEGDTLVIPAGTTLYFEPLTGMDIRGALTAAGTLAAPVILTSVNDTASAPAPAQGFDWNGVKTQGPSAVLDLRHTHISHSVYGVSVRDAGAGVSLESVVFDNNGYASLVRGEHIVPVRAGEPFGAKWNIADEGIIDDEPADNAAGAAPTKPACKHKTKGRLIINVSALGLTAAGLTVYTVNLAQKNTYFKQYTRDGNSQRLSAYYEEKIRGNMKMGAAGAAITGAGLGCLTATLFF